MSCQAATVVLLQFESGFRVAHSSILLHFDKNNFTVAKLSGEPTTSRYRMQRRYAQRQFIYWSMANVRTY